MSTPVNDGATRDHEPVNVGIGKSTHPKLQRLKEDGHFSEMLDAYRFAIGLALAHGGATADFSERQNLFNIGTLDPDRSLYTAVATLRQPTDEPVYKTVERLATWGVEELDRRSQRGMLSFADILGEAEALLEGAGH
jgi:hypothetical protein